MFSKLVECRYEKINKRYVGLDYWGHEEYQYDWRTIRSLTLLGKAVVTSVIIAIVMVAMVAGFLMGVDGEDDVVVMEETTTTAESIIVESKVYGPEWVVQDLYVCNTVTSSNEYTFVDDTNVWSDGQLHDVDWTQLLRKQVIMVWEINDDQMLRDFKADIDLFNRYTKAGIRVEMPGYIAREDDFVIPVTLGDAEGGWAHMALEFVLEGEFFGLPEWVWIDSASLVIDESMMEESTWIGSNGAITTGWAIDHTVTVLHEMGHLFGLGHTHDEVGEQVDSIMSYESDRSVRGFLPGDIAGLKEVFC